MSSNHLECNYHHSLDIQKAGVDSNWPLFTYLTLNNLLKFPKLHFLELVDNQENKAHRELCTFLVLFIDDKASLVAQMVKHLPAMRETRVRSLGWQDPLEKEMPSHSSTLPWKIPRTEEPGRLQSMGLQRVRHD